MDDEKAPPPITVRFSEDERKIVDAARNLEEETLSVFIRRVVMDEAMRRIRETYVR